MSRQSTRVHKIEASTDWCGWHPKGRSFTIEDSQLNEQKPRGCMPQVIVLRNPKTGGTASFVLTSWKTDGEGDVMFWKYVCNEKNLTLTVFND